MEKFRSISSLSNKLKQRLSFIYQKEDTDQLVEQSINIIKRYEKNIPLSGKKWDEKEVILITYGDSIVSDNQAPLDTLNDFVKSFLPEEISLIHILPFFPYSSDDGFSVIDYKKVRPDLGNWDNIEDLHQHFDLAADLVINHISSKSQWFKNFLADKAPENGYFIVEDPAKDLSQVTRPRSTPLLTQYKTKSGEKHVWTTFSADQIDLNFENPKVYLEMLEIMLMYISKGIRMIRLDAIAFLWKKAGTTCLHLEETHEFVKLFRDIFDYLGSSYVLLTETNVPNEENLSYFGKGDEANMIYQFSLPPLLLYSFFSENANYFNQWAKSLPTPPEEATYFNFTASHDGIGVRPLAGLVPDNQKQGLYDHVIKQGGKISEKSNPDGSTSPYEMNITYLDALKETKYADSSMQIDRFVSSQTLMAAFKGVPAFYIHSLLGTNNDYEGFQQTKRARTLNRKKWKYGELKEKLSLHTHHRTILNRLKQMLQIRKAQEAFHPDAKQEWIMANDNLIAFKRMGTSQEIVCVCNVTSRNQAITIQSKSPAIELLHQEKFSVGYSDVIIEPFQSFWFSSSVNSLTIQ